MSLGGNKTSSMFDLQEVWTGKSGSCVQLQMLQQHPPHVQPQVCGGSQQPMVEMEMHKPHLKGGGQNHRNHENRASPKYLDTDTTAASVWRNPAGVQGFAQLWCVGYLPSANVETIHWPSLPQPAASAAAHKAWSFPEHKVTAEPKKRIWESSSGKRKQSQPPFLPESLCQYLK